MNDNLHSVLYLEMVLNRMQLFPMRRLYRDLHLRTLVSIYLPSIASLVDSQSLSIFSSFILNVDEIADARPCNHQLHYMAFGLAQYHQKLFL